MKKASLELRHDFNNWKVGEIRLGRNSGRLYLVVDLTSRQPTVYDLNKKELRKVYSNNYAKVC